MKYIILFIAIFGVGSIAKADVIITKTNRGLFGYKYILEQQAEGQHRVDCSDPGRMRCRTNSGSIIVTEQTAQFDYLEITNNQIDGIESFIAGQLAQSISSGNFIYDNLCYITYSYDPNLDILITRIYSVQEAQSLNII